MTRKASSVTHQIESDLTEKVRSYLKTVNGIWFAKISDRYISGLPDFIVIKNGQTYAIECKSTKGKARPLQAYTLTQMEKAGAIACVIKTIGELKALVF